LSSTLPPPPRPRNIGQRNADNWPSVEALFPHDDELPDRIERLQRRLWLERAGLISLALALGWAGVGSV
jgi:hypothetical protein